MIWLICDTNNYSIHIPGWLMKWLNLITVPDSASSEPGSVTWLATNYLRNHTEKITTFWSQNISFWTELYRHIHYFNAKLLGKYSQTPVWQLWYSCQILHLISFQNNLTWPNSDTVGVEGLGWNTVKLLFGMQKNPSLFTWFLYWKLPVDRDVIHFICHFHQSGGINARECFHGPAAPQSVMLGALIVWWPTSIWCFNWQWQKALCMGAVPNETRRGIKKGKCML